MKKFGYPEIEVVMFRMPCEKIRTGYETSGDDIDLPASPATQSLEF